MVFVDAPNFEKRINSRYPGGRVDWPKFFQKLGDGYDLRAIHWVTSAVYKHENEKVYTNLTNFWANLEKKIPKLTVHKIDMRRSFKPGKKFEESGLDNWFARLMQSEVAQYDRGFVLTCDSDQELIVRSLQGDPFRKRFTLVTLKNAAAFRMGKTCDDVISIDTEWLDTCWRVRPSKTDNMKRAGD